ncbi:hypothetical protein KP001_09925 [Geomonas subterranea]|uniref:Uncharacterized protein n=1 Tax=Geomonas subterranea TaxID=2847989 RepID=A0ABX8LM92_9BACT|nr:hypothetical protein [Geomonas subterranea]QXE92807.1 hypothetical protein KP001_09925 [Geomonas subterranea]QXM09090.1 hypothetical protein KP002_19350 [Geomonas subterranea]
MSAVVITLLSAGCASNPDVTFKYYPATWKASATVVQTIACSKDQKRIVISNVPSVATTYYSDLKGQPKFLKIKDLDTFWADSSLTMSFTDDGRLKSINQNTTGQGETIIKSAVAVSATLAALAAIEKDVIPECKVVAQFANDKPVTIIYRKEDIGPSFIGKTAEMTASPESKDLYEAFQGKKMDRISRPYIMLISSDAITTGVEPPSVTSNNVVLLELQKILPVTFTFKTSKGADIGTSSLVVPDTTPKNALELPIPKAALFGGQSLALTLTEAGAISSITYSKTTGAAGSLNALGAIATTQTPTTKAAELKAEADLIAAQQRLTQCAANPEICE